MTGFSLRAAKTGGTDVILRPWRQVLGMCGISRNRQGTAIVQIASSPGLSLDFLRFTSHPYSADLISIGTFVLTERNLIPLLAVPTARDGRRIDICGFLFRRKYSSVGPSPPSLVSSADHCSSRTGLGQSRPGMLRSSLTIRDDQHDDFKSIEIEADASALWTSRGPDGCTTCRAE